MLYYSFTVFTWDLGIFNQAFWNTLHGRLLYYTAEPFYTKTGCFLAAHFSPLLLAIVPFYAICPRPENLLVIGTFAVALGAWPAYEIAKFFLRNEKVAVALGIFYLLYLPLQGVTLSGFSLESFMATLFLFIVYYLIKLDFKKLALVVALGLITHEAAIPIIAFIAIYGMLHHKSPKNKGFQAALVILAICIPYFFIAEEMRFFFGWTGHPSLWNEWAIIGAKGVADLPFKILLNPVRAFNSLIFDGVEKLLFLLYLLLPVLFLPLLGLRGLIPAAPFFFISFFSSYRLYYSLEGHYAAFFAPFIFLALIHGIIKLKEKRRTKISVKDMANLALLTNIILLIVIVPSTYSKFEVFKISEEHNNIVRDFIARIPQDASVLTQSNIFPHVSSRFDAYTVPPPTWGDNYIQISKETLLNLNARGVKYVLIDYKSPFPYNLAAEFIHTNFVLANRQKYELIGNEDGVMLYKAIIY